MSENIYICYKCGEHFYKSDIRTEQDSETGYVDWFCPFCGAYEEKIYEAEKCEFCGEVFDKDDNEVFGGMCRKCIDENFDYDAAFRHFKKCIDCARIFTLKLTDMDDMVSLASGRMAAITVNYAEIVRNKAQSIPDWDKSVFAKDIEKCIRETCIGEDSDLDHYVQCVYKKGGAVT